MRIIGARYRQLKGRYEETTALIAAGRIPLDRGMVRLAKIDKAIYAAMGKDIAQWESQWREAHRTESGTQAPSTRGVR